MDVPLLVIRHVPWEGPHRILDAFAGRPRVLVDAIDEPAALPALGDVCGAVVMGGPMSANDAERHGALAEEIAWLRQALDHRLPVLGVCLGSQLLARAAGARVRAAPSPEIGVAPVQVLDPADPLLGPLAPSAPVLHWHGEVFDLPPGATALARSEATAHQAFRIADHAWGLLFHAEADAALVDAWLEEPTMAAEARQALGADYARRLRADVALLAPQRGDAVFAAFAERVARPR